MGFIGEQGLNGYYKYILSIQDVLMIFNFTFSLRFNKNKGLCQTNLKNKGQAH
jgi:hypothetical protein